MFASANVQSGGVDSTIQAASLLYATVNGVLNKASRLDGISLPNLLFSPDITYGYTLTDTGNVYETIYTVAGLSNPLASSRAETAAHTVIPGKPRTLTGTLPAPLYPGIYTATIGYRTDAGVLVTRSKPVLYLPLWGVVVVIGIGLVAIRVITTIRRHRRRRKTLR